MKLNKEGMAPCPGCGKSATRVVTAYRHDDVYGECIGADCHMSGPLGKDKADAVARWNALPRHAAPGVHKQVTEQPCGMCGLPFDQDSLGMYGCPNCHGEGLEK